MSKLFRNDSPGAKTLEQARADEIKRQRELRRKAAELAAEGRGEDTEIAHVARGEMVIPEVMQTPELMAIIARAAKAQGISIAQLRVGGRGNSINPNTGVAEFGASEPYRYNGPVDPGVEVRGSRLPGLVQLPQNVPDSGYYNYGTPGNGRAQFGTPETVALAKQAGAQWQANGGAPMGIGNMSYEDGRKFVSPNGKLEHQGHTTGGQIDIRPMRRDERQERVTWNLNDGSVNPAYDREATQRLVDTWRATGGARNIYFNDPQIKGVTRFEGHDDHIHVETDPLWKKQ